MSDSKTEICQFSLRQLFKSGKYRIPMYQRNYDWGEVEVIQLLEDIIDYSINFPNNNYYLGSLIVVRKNNYYETIDGQQRLTTLNILMCALKSILKEERETQLDWFKQCNITFEFREDSNVTMRKLINGIEDGSNNIINIYHILHKALVKHLKNSNIEQFVDYFLGRVVILRIPLPEDTVLNHYFEIMNSRGEQLEKHEVLKAYLMKLIPSEEHELFNQIWEACSNMNKYVQMEIKKPLRELLFGKDLNSLTNLEFDDIYKRTMVSSEKNHDNGEECHTIMSLIEDAIKNKQYFNPYDEESVDKNKEEHFSSVSNFTNFLLHVLKIQYKKEKSYNDSVNAKIVLDDKRLLDIFSYVLNNVNKEEQTKLVKRFIMKMLSLRFLFDSNIIKRESQKDTDNWTIKKIQIENNNVWYIKTFGKKEDKNEDNETGKDICMLQAMFHVSSPSQIYKYWLHAVLYQLDTNPKITPEDFKRYLFFLAKTYMEDHYLSEEPRDFFDIIYGVQEIKNSVVAWANMDKGCGVENFIFNYYDYIIWQKNKNKYSKFIFTYRTSVEHFYPQHPINDNQGMDEEHLNKFGNLCLISSSMNSKFSNNMPLAKCDNFENMIESLQLSIKLQEMMQNTKKLGKWLREEIDMFDKEAKGEIAKSFSWQL